jgi:hypothetical protein
MPIGDPGENMENEERRRDFMSEIGYKMFKNGQVKNLGKVPDL